MLVERQNAADFLVGDFSPVTGGGIELIVPQSGPNLQWRILTAGYVAGGAPHQFEFFLAPLGPVTQYRIPLVNSPAAGANTFSTCDIWIPRNNRLTSWTIRLGTSGKTATGFLAVNLELLQVGQ